jgi:hypothetical protein
MLGTDSKTISQLGIEGIIKAARRPSRRLPQQGGAPHSITPAALRQFVIDHVERIDFRRVDKVCPGAASHRVMKTAAFPYRGGDRLPVLSEGFIEDEGQPDATLAVLNCDILRCRGHVVVAQPVDMFGAWLPGVGHTHRPSQS